MSDQESGLSEIQRKIAHTLMALQTPMTSASVVATRIDDNPHSASTSSKVRFLLPADTDIRSDVPSVRQPTDRDKQMKGFYLSTPELQTDAIGVASFATLCKAFEDLNTLDPEDLTAVAGANALTLKRGQKTVVLEWDGCSSKYVWRTVPVKGLGATIDDGFRGRPTFSGSTLADRSSKYMYEVQITIGNARLPDGSEIMIQPDDATSANPGISQRSKVSEVPEEAEEPRLAKKARRCTLTFHEGSLFSAIDDHVSALLRTAKRRSVSSWNTPSYVSPEDDPDQYRLNELQIIGLKGSALLHGDRNGDKARDILYDVTLNGSMNKEPI